jgi:hypothetical protein
VSKVDAVGRTDVIGTGRDKPSIHPMITEVALLRDDFIVIKPDGVIGT